jgi:alcohol dehydrogenase (cytochrome c)
MRQTIWISSIAALAAGIVIAQGPPAGQADNPAKSNTKGQTKGVPRNPTQSPASQPPPKTATPQTYPVEQIRAGEQRFASQCGFCHGRDAAGGETGPDLTRSKLVAEDKRGDKIGPLLRTGRPDQGMPAFNLNDKDLGAIVAFIHDQKTKAESLAGGRRSVDAGDLATGNAEAGRLYFNRAGSCSGCHSATGDLAGVATRYEGLDLLQRMLYPGGKPAPSLPDVTVSLASGETVAGRLASEDEFTLVVLDSSGDRKTYQKSAVQYKIDDPLSAHFGQLGKYTDYEMLNVYAYLDTLKLPTVVDPKDLLHPPADSWLTYHGNYTGQRHTSLTQITPENVGKLRQVWRFETGQNPQIKASPILANGVLYVTTPDNIWVIDARTAKELWHYQNPPNDAFHIGHRGAAIYKDTVYLTTPDCHLIALNVKDGKVKWNVVIADSKKGYWSTNAPLVIVNKGGNHVLVGVSGDFDNLPGQLKSVDPDTGAPQWIFYSTPPPGAKEPNSGGATGGQMWTTGTYDPDLDLVYVGTGNPTPVLNGAIRPGNNPWTCSIVAINPNNGKLVWGFQASPHDTHDWDANEVPVLADANFNGQPRKLLMQASRNGYFFVLDRTNGKSLLTTPFATVNWAKGIDPEGHPIPDPAKYPSKSGVLVAPNESGATNFRPPSFDPKTGLFVVSAQDGYGIYFFKPEHGAYGWAGADYGVAGRAFLRAIDYQTGKIVWDHPIGNGAGAAGVLTTETGVTFSGDVSGNAMALRTSDGATLWHAAIGKIGNAPISYELAGRQYVVVGGGSSLYAFALPRGGSQ